MTDYSDITDDVDDDESEDAPEAKTTGAGKRERALRLELAELRRKDVFRDAGVDVTTALGKAALKAFDGDLSVDNVKAYATELGAIKAAEPPEPETPAVLDPVIGLTEQASTAERQALASGAVPDTGVIDVNPNELAKEAYFKTLENGTEDDAMSAFLAEKVQAAMRGDQRVIIQDNETARI